MELEIVFAFKIFLVECGKGNFAAIVLLDGLVQSVNIVALDCTTAFLVQGMEIAAMELEGQANVLVKRVTLEKIALSSAQEHQIHQFATTMLGFVLRRRAPQFASAMLDMLH